MWKTNVMRTSRQPSSVEITMDRKQPEIVEYFSCLGGFRANYMQDVYVKSDPGFP
jgi:hypothetical protein